MQLQGEPRIRKRVPCTLRSGGREHTGMVLNLSRGGLFVQTSANARPGDDVSLELNVAPGGAGIPVGARVVWRRVVAPQLRSVSHGGFGVRIENAPEDYFRFLTGMTPAARPEQTTRPPVRREAPSHEYRVRLKQVAGPRTRWVRVRSTSEADARRRALSEVGEGWAVLHAERSSG